MRVRIQTSFGAIIVELDPQRAPKTVNNFVSYVRDGFYDGTLFHRVMDGFMIQGGGFLPGMTQKPTRTPIENEAKNGLRNERTAPLRNSSSMSSTMISSITQPKPRPAGVTACSARSWTA